MTVPTFMSYVSESHFKLGDTVKCKASGMTGKVVVLDKEDGKDDEKYYTVKRSDGKTMKYAPNELSLVKEDVDQIDELKVSTLTRYGTKAMQSYGRNPEKDDKRLQGMQRAKAKIRQKTMAKEEVVVTEQKHRVSVTVSEPDHPAVSMRKATKQKFVKVTAGSDAEAVKKATAYYKKQGYKIHGAEHVSMVSEGENKQIKGGDPCWKGYQMVGMKPGKGGKKVPNCVPATNEATGSLKPGWMLKKDPKLGAAVKAKQDLAKKRQASYGNPAAGKSMKESLKADVKALRSNTLSAVSNAFSFL